MMFLAITSIDHDKLLDHLGFILVAFAANELGKLTVAMFAKEDKLSLHRFEADAAYKIGERLSLIGPPSLDPRDYPSCQIIGR